MNLARNLIVPVSLPLRSPLAPGLRFVQLHHEDHEAVRRELLAGLAQPQAEVAPKFLYDALGSRLFEAITELPEYYPTRTEAAIFAQHASDMARRLPEGLTLVDMGAGNCLKAEALFPVFRPARYVAVDISVAFLRHALHSLHALHPQLPMLGLGMDFSQERRLDQAEVPAPRVLFYPGSSIGNFTPAQALALLRQACQASVGGGLLIGVDLLKPREQLVPAYDDALGVTAAFNRHLLQRLNGLLGSDFDLPDWQHVACFNAAQSCMEMHLQARRGVQVRWTGGGRRFVAGERIHTERSHKWALADFLDLLAAAGFAHTCAWTDAQGRFAVCWASH